MASEPRPSSALEKRLLDALADVTELDGRPVLIPGEIRAPQVVIVDAVMAVLGAIDWRDAHHFLAGRMVNLLQEVETMSDLEPALEDARAALALHDTAGG